MTAAAPDGARCQHPECGERCDYEPILRAVLMAEAGACAHPECFWTGLMGGCGLAHDASPVSEKPDNGDGRPALAAAASCGPVNQRGG